MYCIQKNKVISENNLSIGSNVSIQYENNTISIKVIGIYTVINTPKTQVSDGYYKEVADSIVFTDYNSYVELNNEASCYGINFFSTDYKSTSLLYDDMSKMFQNVPNSAVVNQVLNEELQMTDVISMLKSMTSVTLSVMYIVCVVVMSLLTVLYEWYRTCGMDALILGCTHFPYFKEALAEQTSLPLIDPAQEMVRLLLAGLKDTQK